MLAGSGLIRSLCLQSMRRAVEGASRGASAAAAEARAKAKAPVWLVLRADCWLIAELKSSVLVPRMQSARYSLDTLSDCDLSIMCR